ncbi:branched-chain amino acid ABC transporter permease [Diaphorobacter sp. HDW4A]|uniref:branched-chain amino acid ABC transporter permease n=1 Tax=Diaphorobacter sp. HDW4A TaxID=2714924 RepID=UPI00140CACB6|nr:branched-chain amino acid ABC transporter permease [Diaphorobacter sp. HDW4A]QIL80602.1 branched-chain amino acid ABC transporter permease [Diaphorobacter sp. HDW4A]
MNASPATHSRNESQGVPTTTSQPTKNAIKGGRWSTWIPGLLVLFALPLLLAGNPFYIHLAVLICLNIIFVNGLALINRTGQLSFCHAAFMGMGAFVAVICTTRFHTPFFISVIAGVIASMLIAFLLGAVILRLQGVYFVLVTFCFGELTRLVLLEGGDLTGGANGIANIPPASLFGFTFDSKLSFYCLAAVCAFLSVVLLIALFKTPKGNSLDAVGDNPDLAEASGISIQGSQMFAFVLGSAFAGFAGALLAHYLGFVSPESFNQHISVAAIIMLVIGGRGSVLGPILGALIMTPLPELFRSAIETQNIMYGITLILVLKFLPMGLVGIGAKRFGKGGK